MSSRWISISFSVPRTPSILLTVACAAFTSEDLPMPRAPHNSALFAGRPRAKRSVFSIRMSRIRSTPFSRSSSTRLTFGTGIRCPVGCQTNASAVRSDSGVETVWLDFGRPAAMASSARAIRSSIPSGLAVARFAAATTGLRVRVLPLAGAELRAGRFLEEGVLRVVLAMIPVVSVDCGGTLSERHAPRQPMEMTGWPALQLGRWPL